MSHEMKSKIKSVQVEAVVTRKDGTVENLGTISRWHKNPLIRAKWFIEDNLKRLEKWASKT